MPISLSVNLAKRVLCALACTAKVAWCWSPRVHPVGWVVAADLSRFNRVFGLVTGTAGVVVS